jgi:hypothetical protein
MSTNEKPMAKALAVLGALSPVEVLDNQSVRNKFITVFESNHGKKDGARIYEVEKFHFQKQIIENPELQKCSPISIYGAFIDMAAQGLSVDPAKKLGYILSDNINVGSKDSPKWEKRAKFQAQARGELVIRQQMGQILRADNPVIVYEGDYYRKYTVPSGQLHIEYEAKFESTRIISCFIRLILPNGDIDFKDLDLTKIQSLKDRSAKKNKGEANSNYTSCNGGIDPGFLETKCIKHAFSSYPKAKARGSFIELATENPANNEEEIDYDLETGEVIPIQAPEQTPAPSIAKAPDNIQTEATIIMTGKPSDPGTPVTVEDFDNF